MPVEPNIVISEFIVNQPDPLYSADNSDVNISNAVKTQAESLAFHNTPYYVLTNDPNQQNNSYLPNLHIEHISLFDHFPNLSLYFNRLVMAYDFLKAHPEIKKVALTDATDVEMLNYPFDKVEENKLYFGDESVLIFDTSIIIANNNPEYMQDFLYSNGHLPILNLGIIVGTREVILEFLGIVVKLITDEEVKMKQGDPNAHLGEFEMAITNYVAYRFFKGRLVHGRMVSTIFHCGQRNSSAWFKHK